MIAAAHPFLSYRRAAITGLAFLVASASAVVLTRFGGGPTFLWVANAVVLASLLTTDPKRWPMLVATCWIAGTLAAGIWGMGWRFGPFIAAVNVAEPVIAAGLLIRWEVSRSSLDSARQLGLFVLAAGIVAPALSAFGGAFVISLGTPATFAQIYVPWVIGHGLGAITFTPIFVQLASGELEREVRRATTRQMSEAVLLLALVAATAVAVFCQSWLPVLFVPVLPLMLVTFHVGRVGAALAIAIISVIGIGLTLHGQGPVNLISASIGPRLQFMQFYLAVTVMTVLPVAADLAHRGQLFARLRDSEARFRLLTELSTDIVMNLDVDGTIRYISPSIALLGGYDPDALLGRSSAILVGREDRERVQGVHRQAVEHPNKTFSVEFRGVVPGEDQRWFETNTRAVVDDDGVVRGVVSAVRDTSVRRRTEVELSRAALTDPLTGICNRRAFDRELAQRLAAADDTQTGCVAAFDLDHFKQVNDRFGHATGDAVLRAFARIAESQVRGGDMLARIGGEEFALIFSGITVERAAAVCERIREAVASAPVKAGDWPVRVTVSIGIAAFGGRHDPATVLSRADQALYAAKDDGRNRVSVAA